MKKSMENKAWIIWRVSKSQVNSGNQALPFQISHWIQNEPNVSDFLLHCYSFYLLPSRFFTQNISSRNCFKRLFCFCPKPMPWSWFDSILLTFKNWSFTIIYKEVNMKTKNIIKHTSEVTNIYNNIYNYLKKGNTSHFPQLLSPFSHKLEKL